MSFAFAAKKYFFYRTVLTAKSDVIIVFSNERSNTREKFITFSLTKNTDVMFIVNMYYAC